MKKVNCFVLLLTLSVMSAGLSVGTVQADQRMQGIDPALSMAVSQAQNQAAATQTQPPASLQPMSQAMEQMQSPQESQEKSETVFKGYRKSLEKRIFKSWKPPAYTEKKSSVVRFVLDKEGRLLTMTMIESSGIPALDQSVQDAVVQAAPFKHFPRKYDGAQMPFEFTFEYTPKEKVAKNPAAKSPVQDFSSMPQTGAPQAVESQPVSEKAVPPVEPSPAEPAAEPSK